MEYENNYEMIEEDLKQYYFFLNDVRNKFYCLRSIDEGIYNSMCEGEEIIQRALNRMGEVLRERDKTRNHLREKQIKKMKWSNDGFTGIKINIETDDGYILQYSLGNDGNLKYIKTTDAG